MTKADISLITSMLKSIIRYSGRTDDKAEETLQYVQSLIDDLEQKH